MANSSLTLVQEMIGALRDGGWDHRHPFSRALVWEQSATICNTETPNEVRYQSESAAKHSTFTPMKTFYEVLHDTRLENVPAMMKLPHSDFSQPLAEPRAHLTNSLFEVGNHSMHSSIN